ncbi:MAG: hypothetical protein FWD75_10080 [Propionibacteriaceae bacterium]|nr:hypothetical protein [Propionibacteriaceae bacterium]
MALVTESTLREQFCNPAALAGTRYEAPAGTVVSPAARAWLIDQRMDLVIGGKVIFAAPRCDRVVVDQVKPEPVAGAPSLPDDPGATQVPASALPAFTRPELFDVVDGSQLADKPEHLTALRGNLLVPKGHPQIRFRGLLDSLEAEILVAQVEFLREGSTAGVADLGEVLRYVKNILRSEVLDQPFGHVALFGFDDEELRRRSHHPKDYYGIPHFATSAEDGLGVVLLNRLRTKVREVELAAYDAFAVGGTQPPTRIDLIRALNRLSSAVYIMMFKAKIKEY